MKLGVVCHPTYGGSGVIASQLGLAMAARGHEVHFFSRALPFRVPPEHPNTKFHMVEVTSYPLFRYPPYTLALASKLIEVEKVVELDLIHVHYAIPHAISAYLSRQILGNRAPRIITTLHGTDITLIGLDSSFYEVTRLGINESDAVTAVSEYLANETVTQFRPEKPIRVLPNFVDCTAFSPDLRNDELRARYVRPGEMLVGHLSNFRSVKRVPDIVRAFHLLQRRIPACLLMIGEGVELEPARHLAAELGIQHKVKFVGPVTNVSEVLAQLDLFYLLSEYESFGLSALEAMACGVPVVSTQTGGVAEVIEHEESGILCKVGDFECAAKAGIAILRDPAKRSRMSQAARRRAVDLFNEEKVVRLYEELYHEVVRDR